MEIGLKEGIKPTVSELSLLSAVEAVGGPSELASALGVPENQLQVWLAGMEEPPQGIIFVALHIASSRPITPDRTRSTAKR